MTTITKFFSHEDGAVARVIAAVRRQMSVAIQQHLVVCQVYSDAMVERAKQNAKR